MVGKRFVQGPNLVVRSIHSSTTINQSHNFSQNCINRVLKLIYKAGVVCGLVGFLIINVTVVMALRKYSHWQQRQLRIRQMR